MPIREFKCPKCGKVGERLVLENDDGHFPSFCPDCRVEMSMIMSISSFRLNGGGWADDNYSKK